MPLILVPYRAGCSLWSSLSLLEGHPLVRQQVTNLLSSILASAGVQVTDSRRSFRIGAATAAITAGIPDPLIIGPLVAGPVICFRYTSAPLWIPPALCTTAVPSPVLLSFRSCRGSRSSPGRLGDLLIFQFAGWVLVSMATFQTPRSIKSLPSFGQTWCSRPFASRANPSRPSFLSEV